MCVSVSMRALKRLRVEVSEWVFYFSVLVDHPKQNVPHSFICMAHSFVYSNTHILHVDARSCFCCEQEEKKKRENTTIFQMIHPTTTWFSNLFSVWFCSCVVVVLSLTYDLNAYFSNVYIWLCVRKVEIVYNTLFMPLYHSNFAFSVRRPFPL